MPRVFIPPTIRSLTGNQEVVEAAGQNVREVIASLDEQYPGIRDWLCSDDELRPGLSVVVDGSVSSLKLLQRVSTDAEIHFLPAISGGSRVVAEPCCGGSNASDVNIW